MAKQKSGKSRRVMRHKRVRRKVVGTPERPRLAVFRSLNHVYAQIIDDSKGMTLVSASSIEPEITGQKNGSDKSAVSGLVGKLIAGRAKQQGINTIVFDRGGYKFHGRVAALAKAAREEGLTF